MITMQEWNKFNNLDKTIWLERNHPAGCIGSPRELVRGVGVNDAPYCTQPRIYGKQVRCPAYRAWTSILTRAYSAKFHVKCPTYMGVEICDEWKNFCAFRTWWIENQVDGWQIDKDLMSDSREYSPETSIFVPAWLNSFTLDSGSARGVYQIGVCFHKQSGRFVAGCCNPMSKKREHLGYFTTPEAAHLAWRARKLELALELKPKMDEIDLRIYPIVIEIINSAK